MSRCGLPPRPLRPPRHICEDNALGGQFVPDAVGFGEVLGLLGLEALEDQGVNGRVPLPGDGAAVLGGGGGLGGFLALGLGLRQEVQAQDLGI